MPRNFKDAQLIKTKALPGSASSSTTTDDIDLGANMTDMPEEVEVLVNVPALSTTILPDTRTLTVQLQAGDSASPTTAIGEAKVITGAGGAGAAAQEFRFRLPSTVARYLNCKFTLGASTTDASALSGTLALVF